jgi:hypothetical protein
MRQLVVDLDAASAAEAKLHATFLQGVREADLSVATLFNGAYTFLDKDGYYFAVYGTGLYKFGYKDPADPLSGIQLVKSLDLKAALPADLAATLSRVIGINLTADGRIAFAMSGLVGVVDRELGGLQFITIAGEAIDNTLAADAQGGLYVVTDKFMRKLVWTGKQLSANEADGAWKSAYDIADIHIPGIVSLGIGTTPTLIGTGPGEDKLVAIADFGDPVRVVVFWADAIPTDFEQKPGTKSRHIADQVSVRMGSRGTIESSFVGFGNGFVAYNQVVSLSYLDRSVQAEEIGVPIDRVDQQTVPERDTTATRRSSTPGRSSQLPWPVFVAASVVAILSRGWVRPSAVPASSCHGATPHACTPATTTAVFPTMVALCCTHGSCAAVDDGVGEAPDALVRQRWY